MNALIDEARRTNTKVNPIELRKAFALKKDLLELNGLHLLSLNDVLSISDLEFLIDWFEPDLLEPDVSGSTGLHYAAEIGMEHAFEKIDRFENPMRKSDGHTVLSLLITGERISILDSLVRRFQLRFHDSCFTDVYVSWLHEALYIGASSVVLYLFKQPDFELCFTPRQDYTPLDLVLLSEHLSTVQRHMYVDRVLSNVPGGFKLKAVKPKDLLMYSNAIGEISCSFSAVQFILRCAKDSINK